jgi:hypothetical protein
MHTAIEWTLVIEKFPLKIASLDPWGDKLVLGCQEGALLVIGEVPVARGGSRFEVKG